jgi:acetyl-CoA carboxylase biotin carboxyl carrier protein
LKKGGDFEPVISPAPLAMMPVAAAQSIPAAAAAPAEKGAAGGAGGREITSPMVGTFYSASAPDVPAFVSVGQTVTPETVVCIIEAMKVMNEIKAEISGVVTEVLGENGKPVQFGQPLFKVK